MDSAMSPLAIVLTKQVTARRTSHYLANSEWTARTIREVLRVGADEVDVIHSMCGVTAAELDRPPRPAPAAGKPLRVLFLGRVAPWKAPDVAVRALPSLRELGLDASLTIAGSSLFGEDEYAAELASLAKTVPGVSLIGHVDDVKPLLESHDVLVHCSTVPEPFGQVIVQGLAAGMPVVATSLGGPIELLEQAPASLLYRAGDPHELAASVQRALDNYQSLSAWGLQRALTLADHTVLQHADDVLAALASGRR